MSREILGFEPTYAPGAGPLAVTGGSFARVFGAGAARGPHYFLVERRDGADGLPLPTPAMLILYVDETAVDNRNCLRLLAAVRAAACAGSGTCDEVLTDDTVPDLRDGDGNPTGLVLRAGGDGVTVGYAGNPPLRLESVRLLDPRDSGGTAARVQPLAITVRNLSDAPLGGTVAVSPRAAGALCATEEGAPGLGTIPAGGTATDTSWVLLACAGSGAVPERTETFDVAVASAGGGPAVSDSVVVAAGGFGLPGDRLAGFTVVNLAAPRRNPWSWDGSAWRAADIQPLADAEIVSPWFTVPEGAALVMDHGWSLDALAPDAALDAGRVEIEVQTGPRETLLPPGGWGFTAERGTGNALGGLDALSGDGDRIHVIDLASYGRRTVRVAFRAAGDADLSGSRWTIRGARVLAAPPVGFTLSEDPAGSRRFLAVADRPVEAGTALILYGGRPAVTATGVVGTGGAAEADTFQAPADPWLRRFELVWIDPRGGGNAGVDHRATARIRSRALRRSQPLPPRKGPDLGGEPLRGVRRGALRLPGDRRRGAAAGRAERGDRGSRTLLGRLGRPGRGGKGARGRGVLPADGAAGRRSGGSPDRAPSVKRTRWTTRGREPETPMNVFPERVPCT